MKDRLILFGLTFVVCLFLCLVGKWTYPTLSIFQWYTPFYVSMNFWWIVILCAGAGILNVIIDYFDLFSNKR